MFRKSASLRATGKKTHWVAIFENNPYPADVRVRPHMESLAAAGYQVTVISLRRQGQPRHEVINGVRVYRFFLPSYGIKVAGYFMEFLHATIALTIMTLWVWLRHGLDVLHIFNPPDSLFIAALLPRLAGKTVIFDLRDLSPELYASKYERPNRFLYGILVFLERTAGRLANHVITTNESYRRIVIERDGVAQARVSVIRQGPDLKRGYSTEPDPDLRARAKTIIGYLGLMAKEDGIDHLLRALHHLDQDFGHKDWYCVLVGPANDLEALRRLAEELGVGDRVWFTGYLAFERWVPILSATDICIEPAPANPVNNISTTNKIMDYMALGKPAVGYGLSEQRVTAGKAALYAKPNEPMDMARQISLLIEDPDLRMQMGAIGRRRIEEHLAWHHQKKLFITLCTSFVHTPTHFSRPDPLD